MYTKTANSSVGSSLKQKIADYVILVKLRLSLLVVFSSVMAYLIAASGVINWLEVVLLAVGGFLVTGAANALNQVLERESDQLMSRTANRPLATGRMSVSEGVLSAGFMSLAGILVLATFNPWTALLGTISLILYAFVYTPMKKITPIAVIVGAIPGALPMMIGCVAFEGTITMLALTLFAIQFLWQFPHFWAIGWFLFDDYKKGGFFMLPTGKKNKATALQIIMYTVWLILISIFPVSGLTGELKLSIVAAILVFLSGIGLLYYGIRLYRNMDNKSAKALMLASVGYITLMQIIYVVDKFLQ